MHTYLKKNHKDLGSSFTSKLTHVVARGFQFMFCWADSLSSSLSFGPLHRAVHNVACFLLYEKDTHTHIGPRMKAKAYL